MRRHAQTDLCDEDHKRLVQTGGTGVFFFGQLSIIEMMGPYQKLRTIPSAPALLRIDVNGMLPWLGV